MFIQDPFCRVVVCTDKRTDNNLTVFTLKCTSFSPTVPPPGNSPMERIHYARLKEQLTISELSSASGVHQNSINLIELNKRNPCVTTIKPILDVRECFVY